MIGLIPKKWLQERGLGRRRSAWLTPFSPEPGPPRPFHKITTKKILTIFFALAAAATAAPVFAAVSYTRTPSGPGPIPSPVSFNASFDSFSEMQLDPSDNYWGIYIDDQNYGVLSSCTPSTTLSQNVPLSLHDGLWYSVDLAGSPTLEDCMCDINSCNVNDRGYLLEGEINGPNPTFAVAATAAVNPGQGEGASGSGSSFVAHLPQVVLRTKLTGQIVKGVVPIEYAASDEDDKDPFTAPYGLRINPGPVDIDYLTGAWPNISRESLALAQPASGTYQWDTTKFSDGTYRLKLKAWGKDGNLTEVGTEDFVIDNTPPKFTVHASPYFTKGDTVHLEIWSSEILKSLPALTVTQFRHDPVETTVLQDTEKHQNLAFKADYKPVDGFDGPALISLGGEDRAGNIGAAIVGDLSFAVGIKPPPVPVIDEPRNESETTSSLAAVSGFGLNAKKVVARVNGGREYIFPDLKDGKFRFDVRLDPAFDKGKNVINVVSYDPSGNISAPATVNIFLNSPPQLRLTNFGRRLTFKNMMTLRWSASDINGDAIVYDVALSDDRGNTWKNLATGLKNTELLWNTTEVPDGSNYMLRVTASDGKLQTSVVTNVFTIANGLPAIVLETSGDFYTSERSRMFGGVVRSKSDLLKSLEWSSDGISWRAVQPDDGIWDSVFEKFHFVVPFVRAGSYDVLLRGQTVSGRRVANAQKLKVIFDNNAPTVHPEVLPIKTVTVPYLRLNGTASDDFSGVKAVEYSIDDSPWYRGIVGEGIETKSAKFKIDHPDKLADGLHRVGVRAIDRAGNASKVNTQNLSIDATPPRLGSFALRINNNLIFPYEASKFGVPVGAELRLQVAITSRPKKVEFLVNEKKVDIKGSSSSSLWESEFVFSGQSTTLRLAAEDEVGNRNERDLATLVPAPQVSSPSASVPKPSFFRRLINIFIK